MKANEQTEATGNPGQRARLSALALAAWDLNRRQDDSARGRLIALRTRARLIQVAESERSVPPEQRSFLKIASDGQDGCLLLHGITGGPADMLPLGNLLHDGGFTVYAPMLTGHGSGSLSRTEARWRANLLTARQSHQMLRASCRRVHVVGTSFGAALALHMATRERVASLALLAPALMPRASFGVRLLLALNLHRLPMIGRRVHFTNDALEGMRWAREAAHQVTSPIFAAQAEDDQVLSPTSVRLLQKRVRHKASRFRVFPEGGHDVMSTHGEAGLYQEILEFFREHRTD